MNQMTTSPSWLQPIHIQAYKMVSAIQRAPPRSNSKHEFGCVVNLCSEDYPGRRETQAYGST